MMTHPPFPSASLYVGDLASDVSEGQLFEIFNQIGPVSLIRVCRDAVSRRRSLGYAYVNYHNILDAERALEVLNNNPIKGKNCRIMWSQRDPSLRKSGVGNVFVKNLNRNFGHKELLELFSEVGNILSCKVACDPFTNQSRGFGFVHFENPEDAKRAQEKFNGYKLGDKELYVGPFLPKKERTPAEDRFTNLFVKNLEEDIDVNKLKEIFGVYGKITSAYVAFEENASSPEKTTEGESKEAQTPQESQKTKKSKCFGFVNFEQHSQAIAAIEGLHMKPLKEGGKQLYVGKAQKKSDRVAELRLKFYQRNKRAEPLGVNLYVRNLDEDYTDENLKNDFQAFGPVLNAKIMKDEKGASRCYGFVCFRNKDDSQRVLQEYKQINRLGQPIHVALAHKKNKRPFPPRGGSSGAPQNNYYQNNNNTNINSPSVPSTHYQGRVGISNTGRGGSRQNFPRRYNGNNAGRGGSSAGNQRNNNNNRNNNNISNINNNKSNNNNNNAKGQNRKEEASKFQKQIYSHSNANNAPKKEYKPQENKPEKETVPFSTPAPAPTPAPASTPFPAPSTSEPQPQQQTPPVASAAIPPVDEISEKLFELISKTQPELAPKITGMLIESFPEPKDLAAFLTDEVALQNKINEAITLC